MTFFLLSLFARCPHSLRDRGSPVQLHYTAMIASSRMNSVHNLLFNLLLLFIPRPFLSLLHQLYFLNQFLFHQSVSQNLVDFYAFSTKKAF